MQNKKETSLFEAYKKTLEYSVDNKNGCRSSKRTDILNEHLIGFISRLLSNPDEWTTSVEEKIACTRANHEEPNKQFTIDIIFEHLNTKRKIYILLKSIESSYNKNRQNFANTTIGEVERIHGYSEFHGAKLKKERENDVTVFLTLIPQYCPTPSGAETIKYSTPANNNLRIFNPNIHQISAIMSCDEKSATTKQNLLTSLDGNILHPLKTRKDIESLERNIERILSI